MIVDMKDIKEAHTIAQYYNVTCLFGYTDDGSEADVEDRIIVIDLCEVKSIGQFWSLFFHEIAHIWCYDNDKYYEYHAETLPIREYTRYIRKVGLRAERYVDSIGKKLMKEYFPYIKHRPTYQSEEDVKSYRDWLDQNYPA